MASRSGSGSRPRSRVARRAIALGSIGVVAQDLAVAGLGLGHLAEDLVEAPPVQEGVPQAGPDLEGPAVRVGRLLVPALLMQRPAQAVVGVGPLGPKRDQPLVPRDRGGVVLRVGMGIRQRLPEVRVVGGQLDGPTEAGDRLGEPAVPLEGKAAIGVDLRQVGCQPDRLGEGGMGLGPSFQGPAGVAEVVVSGRKVGPRSDGLPAVSQPSSASPESTSAWPRFARASARFPSSSTAARNASRASSARPRSRSEVPRLFRASRTRA